jgi:uncharacterized HAD superfamily protein
MNIAVDLDGVCFRFSKKILEYCSLKYGYHVSEKDITKWNWWEIPDFPLTEENFLEAFEEFNKNRMWQSLEIYEDVQMSLCVLGKEHSIHYLTDRPRTARRATLKALLKHGLPIDSVVFCASYSKVKVAEALDIRVAIDDKPSTIEEYSKSEIVTPVVRSQPYNEEIGCDIARVSSMTEFVEFVNNHEVNS